MESYTMTRKSIILIATILQSVTLTTMAVTIDLGNVNRQLLSDSVHHRSLPLQQATGDHRTIRPHNAQITATAANRTGRRLPEVQKNYYHHRPSSAAAVNVSAAALQLKRAPKPTHQYGAGSAVSARYPSSPDWTPIAVTTPSLQLKKRLQDAAPGNNNVNSLNRHPDFVTFVTPLPPSPMPPTPLQQTAVQENRGNKDLHHLQNDYSIQKNDDGRGTKDNYAAVHLGGYNNDNLLQYVVNTAVAGNGGLIEAKKSSYDANDYAAHVHQKNDNYFGQDTNPSLDDARNKVHVHLGYVNDEQLVVEERHERRPQNYISTATAAVDKQTVVQQQPLENYGVHQQSSNNNLQVGTTLNLPKHAQMDADEALTAEGEVLTAAVEDWNTFEDENVANPKFDGGDAKKGGTGVGDGHANADGAVVVQATGRVVDDNNEITSGTDVKDKNKRRGANSEKDTRKGTAGRRRIRPYHSSGHTAATAPDSDYGSAVAQSHRVHQLDRDEEIGGSRGPSAVAAVVVTKSSAVLQQRRRKVQSSPTRSGGLKRRTRPTQVVAVHREHGDDDYGDLHLSTTTDDGQNGSDELNDHGGYHRRSTTTSSDTSTVASSNRRQTSVVVEDEGTAEGVEKTDKEQGQLLGGYGYGYTVLDENVGMDFGQWERREPGPFGTVTGQYRVRLPDGRTQTVEYSANADTGYRALVTYEGVQHQPAAPSSVARYDSDADETSSGYKNH